MTLIRKAGLLVVCNRRMLLCRKKGRAGKLILPGGKFENEETAVQCLEREIREELGDVRLLGLEPVGTYEDVAAEGGKRIRVELFSGHLEGSPQASSEIKELVWFGEADDRSQLAPSLINKIIPDLITRSLLPWRK